MSCINWWASEIFTSGIPIFILQFNYHENSPQFRRKQRLMLLLNAEVKQMQ